MEMVQATVPRTRERAAPVVLRVPLAFKELVTEKRRFKIYYGGRGGAKSWAFARALISKAYKEKLRILCARELQTSIRDSVHKLLSDQIEEMELSRYFDITERAIRGINGSEFLFKGLKHNIAEIKSLEGIDLCWVEEAQNVSKTSWDLLLPTVLRTEDPEVWISFNPSLDTDETYKRFVLQADARMLVKKVGWQDNPWLPAGLQEEKESLAVKSPDAYLNIWEGHCKQTLEGAVYANELRDATLAGRITRVPYDPTKPVHTFWDLGWSDSVAIWFAQAVGFEYRVIEYLEDNQRTIHHFLQTLQAKGYVYGTDYMPHDAANKTLAAGGRSIEQIMRDANRTVMVLPNITVASGINAARTIFPLCYFDEEKCRDGLQCLRHYRYEIDEDTGTWSKKPVHDHYSHGADAFRMLALSLQEQKKIALKLPSPRVVEVPLRRGNWMGR